MGADLYCGCSVEIGGFSQVHSSGKIDSRKIAVLVGDGNVKNSEDWTGLRFKLRRFLCGFCAVHFLFFLSTSRKISECQKCDGQTSIMASEVEVKQASPSTPQSVSQPETPVEGNGNNGGFVFNEQTNYVPKRTIITVATYIPWLVFERC